jgi:hypothetical protein
MLNEEPAQSQDLQMMGMLLPLGIEKGKDFKPDVATGHLRIFLLLAFILTGTIVVEAATGAGATP